MSDGDVVWLNTIGLADLSSVGGKNASLGEMMRVLADSGGPGGGVRVPAGFAITAAAYRTFVAGNGLADLIREQLDGYRSGRLTLRKAGRTVREAFLAGEIPAAVAGDIRSFYRTLSSDAGVTDLSVAVRSSATAEDLAETSFAGQQETFLNVSGERDLLDACRRCFASLYTDRAISYREARTVDQPDLALSVGVQRMVRSDHAGSGVMFSIDAGSGFPGAAVISAAWGLGEMVVRGAVEPDTYRVFKALLAEPDCEPIIEKTLGSKERKLVYAEGASARTRVIDTPERERRAFVLSDAEILLLGRWARVVEDHYGRAMDIEWAKDGLTDEVFLVQARPETVHSQKSLTRYTTSRLSESGSVLFSGVAVGDGIASGTACVIRDAADIENFRDGAILVTEMTDPDWVPIMRRAAGIITDHGGATSHAAIVSRELGLPAVVGARTATEVLAENAPVTISCAEGDEGFVYAGILAVESEEIDLGAVPQTRTQVMVNIASPAAAFQWWRLPTAGVGLARMEFIIADLVKIHPMALVHPDRITDPAVLRRMSELTRGHDDLAAYFVDTLALGIAKLAAPYHPNPVIVRLSDFTSSEYANLVGGEVFEQAEENPMLGFRGAARYYDPRYAEGFALECRALKRVRERIGFSNVIVMVPFCRTTAEADRVLEVMAEHGLVRGENGLEVYLMCEVPANVVLAEKFATRFDGFSIGSNDLTQLVLGVDRDSGELADLFDERDEAVTRLISEAIDKAHAAGIKIGICGQGPSDHPDFAEFLVGQGIDSISLNPDILLRTVPRIKDAEVKTAGDWPTLSRLTT
jgi:pyruvate,water dikinase